MKFVNLRNTVSGVTLEYDEKTAAKLLNHRIWSKVLVEVDSPKNEVLSSPYKVESGTRKKVESKDTKAGQE